MSSLNRLFRTDFKCHFPLNIIFLKRIEKKGCMLFRALRNVRD